MAFARAMGGAGERVTTGGELQAAFARAEEAHTPYLIEAVLDNRDVSPVMLRLQGHLLK